MKRNTIFLLGLIIIIGIACLTGAFSSSKKEAGNTTLQEKIQKTAMETNSGAYTMSSGELHWGGGALFGSHSGELTIKEASLKVQDGLKSGHAIVDMNSITSDAGDDLNGHLKSADFFETNKFPEAKINFSEKKDGTYDAQLEIKGISNKIEFAPTFSEKDNEITLESNLSIDRTRWGVNFKSNSALGFAKDQAISDTITINTKVTFTNKKTMDTNLSGKKLSYDYGDSIYHIDFLSEDKLHWESIKGDEKGKKADETYSTQKISEDTILIGWVEADGVVVNQVVNLRTKKVNTFIYVGKEVISVSGTVSEL